MYTVTLLSSNNPKGFAGLYLNDPLVVQVLDENGQPVEGELVSFTAEAGMAPVWIEWRTDSTPQTSPFSGADGKVTVSVRCAAGARGPGSIRAQLENRPSVPARFDFTVGIPGVAIVSTTPLPATAPYGVAQSFRITLNGDPDESHIDYWLSRSTRVNVSGTGCMVACSRYYDFDRTLTVWVVPTTLDPFPFGLTTTVTVTISFPDEMNVQPFSMPHRIPLTVSTPANSARITAIDQTTLAVTASTTLRIVLEPAAGIPTTPSIARAGQTIRPSFAVQATDGPDQFTLGPGNSWGNSSLYQRPDNLPAKTTPLQINWTSDGLSAVLNPKLSPTGSVDIATPVTLTPQLDGYGPYLVSAWLSSSVFDPVNPLPLLTWKTPPLGQVMSGHCYYLGTFNGATPTFQFLVQDGGATITPDVVSVDGAPCLRFSAGPVEDGGRKFLSPTPQVWVTGGLAARDVIVSPDQRHVYFRLVDPVLPGLTPGTGTAKVTVTDSDGTVMTTELTFIDDVTAALTAMPAILLLAGERAEQVARLRPGPPAASDMYLDDLAASIAAYEKVLYALEARMGPADGVAWDSHLEARTMIFRDIINSAGQRWAQSGAAGLRPVAMIQPCGGINDRPDPLQSPFTRIMLAAARGDVVAGSQ